MGWTYFPKPEGVKTWFEKHLTWETDEYTFKCLKSAIVNLQEAYAAVEKKSKTTDEREVWAAVFLLDYNGKKPYDFGYKDMDESMGPTVANCPESIMVLLTEPACNDWAKEWRAKCWKNINTRKARPKLKAGDVIELEREIPGWGKIFTKADSSSYRGGMRNVFVSWETGRFVRLRPYYLNTAKKVEA